MNRARGARSSGKHGAVIDAPGEQGFVPASPGRTRGNQRVRADKQEPEPAAETRSERLRLPLRLRLRVGALADVVGALKVVSGILIVVLVSAASAYGAYRYALTSPRFAVRTLQVEGARRLSEQQIRSLIQLEAGHNIFQLDAEQAERRLLADPWVRQVKITRLLPGTLRVELEERQAYALASIADRLYLLTKTAEPFKPLEPGDPFDLPVVSGLSAEGLGRDRAAELERASEALEVLRSYERLPLSQVHPAQEVNLHEDGSATLVVGSRGIALELGKGPWRKKLLMASRVLEQLQRKGRGSTPGVVFLDNQAHPERVVVRLR